MNILYGATGAESPRPRRRRTWMNYSRLCLGYDVRDARNKCPNLPAVLGVEADGDLYSVDDWMWPTLWHTRLAEIPRPQYLGPTQNLWASLSELREHTEPAVLQHPLETAVFIAIEAFVPLDDEPEAIADTWLARNAEVIPRAINDEWTLLGYDVADYYLGCWLDFEFEQGLDAWNATFGSKSPRTQNGLLLDETDARTFSDALDGRSERNWYVCRLWKLK